MQEAEQQMPDDLPDCRSDIVYILGDSTTAFEIDRCKRVDQWTYVQPDWEAAGFRLCAESGKSSEAWVRQLASVPHGARVVLVGGWNDKGVNVEEVGDNLWALGEALQRGAHGFCRVKLSDEKDLEDAYARVLGSGFNFDHIEKNLEPLNVWSFSNSQGWSIKQDRDHRRWDIEAIGLLRGMVLAHLPPCR